MKTTKLWQRFSSVAKTAWRNFCNFLIDDGPELRVWQSLDRSGHLYWRALDRKTGDSASGSEADIRRWIERHYYS